MLAVGSSDAYADKNYISYWFLAIYRMRPLNTHNPSSVPAKSTLLGDLLSRHDEIAPS